MYAAGSGLGESFVAAIQASLSVLLVIFYGGVAAWLKILNPANTKAISKVCVRLFLPALLFTSIGSELQVENASRYLIIFVWAVVCHLVSFLIGIVAHICFGMPDWTTAALMFNNTTSYPLLLVAALNQTGILSSLIVGDELTSHAIERAKSYFLVFATVSSCLTFAIGPRLIDSEHAADHEDKHHSSDDESQHDHIRQGDDGDETDEEPNDVTSLLGASPAFTIGYNGNRFFPSSRQTSSVQQHMDRKRRPSMLIPIPKKRWYTLGLRAKWWLLFVSDFFNAPLLGAIAGVIVGLIPVLHKTFFNDTYKGGFFAAWLTSSLQSIGGLFVPLPVVVAGVSLYTARVEARQSNLRQATLPWKIVTFILAIRFLIWSLASIAVIHALALHTSILGRDPMLWFAMMLMPTGPPAMKLITLVQISDGGEEDEAIIAKLLTVSQNTVSLVFTDLMTIVRSRILYLLSYPSQSLAVSRLVKQQCEPRLQKFKVCWHVPFGHERLIR